MGRRSPSTARRCADGSSSVCVLTPVSKGTNLSIFFRVLYFAELHLVQLQQGGSGPLSLTAQRRQ